ncbi:hypothetical protein D3C86_1711270 [compost metagenome]
MLQAEDFIDHQPGEHIAMLHHQHPPLLAQRRQFMTEEATHIHDRQQSPTQVGNAPDPGLDARQLSAPRFVQHFADFAHGRDVPALAQAKTDTAPAVLSERLGRQVRRQQTTTPIDLQQQFEGGQRLGHGGDINRPVRCSGS